MHILLARKWILTSLALALMSTPPRADFVGVTWDGDAVRIDPTTGNWTLIGNTGHIQLNAMARHSNGRFVTANIPSQELPHIDYLDPVLGRADICALPFLNGIRALAYSGTDVLYAIDSNDSGTQNDLYTLDLSVPFGDSSIKHFVGTTTLAEIVGMTFATNGTLYGWSYVSGLVVLDPSTAIVTDVNPALGGSTSIQTIAFAPDGTLYGAGDSLFTIDLVTGAPTPVGSAFGVSVRGMEYEDSVSPIPFCFGDGSGRACPCANSGQVGHGCENSSSSGGAYLTATGNTVLSADTLQFTVTGERPTVLSVFWQGHAAVGPATYGDGLRCMGVGLKRLHIENAVAGTVIYPDGVEPPVAARSAALGDPIAPGSVRIYQVSYRDPSQTFCPFPSGGTYNISEALSVTWTP